jgi:Fic family protein
LATLLSKADRALATLSGLGENLLNPRLLIYPFMRREAVLSSRIEGTQSTVSDLMLFEATSHETRKDVKEVSNYVVAMEHGLEREVSLPLSLRLIREIHALLMEGVRGEESKPGEFRKDPNWIGPKGCKLSEATFVPPPVPEMHEALDKLEQFLHADAQLPPLVQTALIHYQFEAIHPFLDGNGRVGRLLIVFFLCAKDLLSQPLLYLSHYFEQHRQRYYALLLDVSMNGAWRPWVEFFLQGIVDQAADALDRSRRMLDLQDRFYERADDARLPPTAQRLVGSLLEMPMVTVAKVVEVLDVSWSGARKAIQGLEDAGILTESGNVGRSKLYVAREIMEILA